MVACGREPRGEMAVGVSAEDRKLWILEGEPGTGGGGGKEGGVTG